MPPVIVARVMYGGPGYIILHSTLSDFLYFVNVYMYNTQERYVPAGRHQPYGVYVILIRIVCMDAASYRI